MRWNIATETEVIGVLERMCSAFAERDPEALMLVLGANPDVVVVTSEAAVLRGRAELSDFVDRYVEGATTYSWEWERHTVSTQGSVALLFAEGTETAATEGRQEQHPYRMTMVLARHGNRWLPIQVHGSSPH